MNPRGVANVMRQQQTEVQEQLRTLRRDLVVDRRDDDRPTREFYRPMSSPRPANVIVVARFPGEPVEALLKRLKRASQDSGLQRRLNRRSPTWYARSRSQRCRDKHRAALRAQWKLARKAAQIDARHAAAGR